MQNTEATQIFVHTGHNAYEERKLPVASTPSVLYSLPSREIGEWTSVMMPNPGGMRANPNLQPDSRTLWWLGGCKQCGGTVVQAWRIMTSLGAMIPSPLHKTPSPSVLSLAGSPVLYSHRRSVDLVMEAQKRE